MKKTRDYSFLLALIATPILIYLYFLNWRTNVIYGDDINIFLYQSGPHSLGDKINMDLSSRSTGLFMDWLYSSW